MKTLYTSIDCYLPIQTMCHRLLYMYIILCLYQYTHPLFVACVNISNLYLEKGETNSYYNIIFNRTISLIFAYKVTIINTGIGQIDPDKYMTSICLFEL